ncbi:hypothetical protein [Streptomyces sp. NPDC097981]|uniref:hypothetical protein n=1 Tax=Streptomyces sp. NPDC097981 TaxID=3155428 RepID=UPI00332C0F8B
MAGRPQGDPRGRTEEANAFAMWLRVVTEGRTTRDLAEELTKAGFPYGKTSWSEFLAGSRLPTPELVEAVVKCRVTKDPAGQFEAGLQLLEAARQAGQAGQAPSETFRPVAPGADVRLGPVAQAYKDLADAQRRTAEAWQKLHESEALRQALEKAVSALEAKCTSLEIELAQAHEGRAELERELEQLRSFRARAGGQLEHARQLEKKAFRILTATEQQLIREEAAVRDLVVRPEATLALTARERSLPRLEQIAKFLEEVEHTLQARGSDLGRLAQELGLQVQPPPPHLTPASSAPPFVPGQREEERDNAVSSEDDALGNPRTGEGPGRSVPLYYTALGLPAVALLSVVTAGFMAGMQAEPGPAVWKLALYGLAGFGAISCVVYMLVVVPEKRYGVASRFWTSLFGFLAFCSCVIGLVVPAIWPSSPWGHFLADFAGLV